MQIVKEITKITPGGIFIPTMGALHEGHMSLVDSALKIKKQKKLKLPIVVSIFVNPLQMDSADQFKSYPRNIKQDTSLLKKRGADIVFVPSTATIYPIEDKFSFNVPSVFNSYEGLYRTSHFAGVANVVLRLFNIVKPHYAIFGKKDFQQLLLIKELVKDFFLNIKIISAPTIREKSGLACSSRNKLLDNDSFKLAPLIYQSLLNIKKAKINDLNYTHITKQEIKKLTQAGFTVDYLAVCNEQLQKPKRGDILMVVIAARIGGVRLIDNLKL